MATESSPQPNRSTWKLITGLILFMLAGAGYWLMGQPVTLTINGQVYPLYTPSLSVATILNSTGLDLTPTDIISPPLTTTLSPGDTLTVQLARPVILQADGRRQQYLTHQSTITNILAEVNITLNGYDELSVNGVRESPATELPPSEITASTNRLMSQLLSRFYVPQTLPAINRPIPVELTVHRAIPLMLHEDGIGSRLFTTQPTLTTALAAQGITLLAEDRLNPPLDTPLSPGLHIYLQRATPLTITVNGQTVSLRTHQKTVGQALLEAGIVLMGQDYSRPATSQLITTEQTIEVIRVQERVELEETFIPYETEWLANDELEIDQQVVLDAGQPGVIKSRVRKRYDNGQELWQQVEDEWLAREPRTRRIAYGTHIVIRTLQTADGPIEYWRKIPMLATGYSAATSGKSPDHPNYGITRTGKQAGFGIAAVDPQVIPLKTKLYVPGYGPATADDTGGLVLGRHIDLAFDEDDPPNIYGWRDVYLRPPIPPRHRIRYVLPQWPQQPQTN